MLALASALAVGFGIVMLLPLLQSIDALKGETTVVIIAHRLSTIRNVDHVYVFDQGRLAEEGAYDELRDAHQSRFGRLVAMQAL